MDPESELLRRTEGFDEGSEICKTVCLGVQYAFVKKQAQSLPDIAVLQACLHGSVPCLPVLRALPLLHPMPERSDSCFAAKPCPGKPVTGCFRNRLNSLRDSQLPVAS